MLITTSILNLFTKDTNVVDQALARVSLRYNRVVISLRASRFQVIQFVFRTLAASVGIIVVIGSSFPPFLIAIVPLGWMYSRFMTLVASFVLLDGMLTPGLALDITWLHHVNFNVSTLFLVLPSYLGFLSRSVVYPRFVRSTIRRSSPKSTNAASTAIRCAICLAHLLTDGWLCASSSSVHQ